MSKILIVEDDEEIAMLEKDYLEINGFITEIISDGSLVEKKVMENSYNLIILDLMLPNVNGYEICKSLREKTDIPILMVTARTESIDKIRGLGLGADDYICKPFDPAELVARVKAHLSRYNRLKTPIVQVLEDDEVLKIGKLTIMLKNWKVYKNEDEIKLPNREFEILKFLALNPNVVFSKEEIYVKIWGYDFLSDNATVTVHINRIREKIEDDSSKPKIIETVWGAGYRLNL